jgi:prepilin-type N-terminal cleavage/methylation domain-containing protein
VLHQRRSLPNAAPRNARMAPSRRCSSFRTSPHPRLAHAHALRAFTLIELMVVLAIMAVVGWAAFGLTASLGRGDPLTSASANLRAVIARGRSQALARHSRFEVFVDFETGSVQPLSRRPAASFSFESSFGAFGRPITLNKPAALTADMIKAPGEPRLDGGCLDVPAGGGASFQVEAELAAEQSPGGVSVSFDFYPRADSSGSPPLGRIIGAGSGWSIDAEMDKDSVNTVRITASLSGTPVTAAVPLALYNWSTVELTASPLTLTLVVNGVPSSGRLRGTEKSDSGYGGTISIGRGPDFLMDNLRVDAIQLGDGVEMANAVLVPPGGDILLAIDHKLFTPLDAGAIPSAPDALGVNDPFQPADTLPPVRRAIIFFDESGGLDSSRHGGPLILRLARRGKEATTEVIDITISTTGVVTERRQKGPNVPEEGEPTP